MGSREIKAEYSKSFNRYSKLCKRLQKEPKNAKLRNQIKQEEELLMLLSALSQGYIVTLE
jgi:hypothetical protein